MNFLGKFKTAWYRYFLIILGSTVILLLFYQGLKIVIVKEKWKALTQSSFFELETKTSPDFIQLKHIDETQSPLVNLSVIKSYKYQNFIDVKQIESIKKLRIGIEYPLGFILKINDTIVLTSPNLIYNSVDNSAYFVAIHQNLTNSKAVSFYYLDVNYLIKGSNKFEIDIISEGKISKNYKPKITVEVLKKGYFINDFHKINKNNEEEIKSDLPVFAINTFGNTIGDEPKIKAILTIENSEQNITTNIKIEKRGKSSQWYNQLSSSYTINTYNKDWKKEDISLLKLPEESEWVLYSPYMDKSLIRNALAYQLSAKTGHYSPRFKFCNLYINEEYMGVYLLVEKPLLSKSRLNLYPDSKKKETFFCKIDRPNPKDYGWFLIEDNDFYSYVNVVSPKLNKIDILRADSLKNHLKEIQNAFTQKLLDHKKIDSLLEIDSFIDFIIISELTKNLDAYRLSFYFSKAPGFPLNIGPVWDFDLAFGNADLGSFYKTTGWCNPNENICPFKMIDWAQIMLKDSIYKERIKKKWLSYRKSFLSNKMAMLSIDSLVNQVKASEVNFHKTIPILDEWVWPNFYVGGTYENEVFYLKCWLLKRMIWMDKELLEIHV